MTSVCSRGRLTDRQAAAFNLNMVKTFSLDLRLRPVVDHENISENRRQQFAERHVIGVHEISVAILVAAKAQDERVRETLVQIFGADIGAPRQFLYAGDLLLQIAERGHYRIDLRLGRFGLELERDDVLLSTPVLDPRLVPRSPASSACPFQRRSAPRACLAR